MYDASGYSKEPEKARFPSLSKQGLMLQQIPQPNDKHKNSGDGSQNESDGCHGQNRIDHKIKDYSTGDFGS